MSDIERNNALRRYVDLKDKAAKLDREAKDAKAAEREQMLLCYEILQKNGTVGATKVDLGPEYGIIRFTPRATTYGDIYDEASFHKWIEENGREDELYFPDKLRMKPVNEMARELKEHGEFPPGLQYREQKGVTVTKEKKS